MKTKILDRAQLDNANYEIYSGGKVGTDRGIIGFKGGKLQEPKWDKLETWIKDSVYTAGMNTFGMLTYSPWESKGIDDVLCPFAREGDKWTLRKINPDWKRIFDETLARIKKVTEPVKNNFVIQVMLFCEPWFHHGSPNPYTNNVEGYRDFYAVPLAKNKVYIDSVIESLQRSGLQYQIIVGCELSVRHGSKVKYYNPSGICEPVYVVPEAIWVWEILQYLQKEHEMDTCDLGGGCVYTEPIKNTKDHYEPIDNHTDLSLEVERIAGRFDKKITGKIHMEFHGACGYWTPNKMAPHAEIVAQWYGAMNTRCAHFNTDGDNARIIGPEYASVYDRQPLYWRYFAKATRDVFAYVMRYCAGRKDGNRLWLTVLPQTWNTDKKYYLENANALADAYKDSCGAYPHNKGIEPPEPKPEPEPIPDPVEPAEPEPIPEPVKPSFSLKGEWSNNKNKILLGIGIVVVLTLIAILFC